jgi:hypothetical protein
MTRIGRDFSQACELKSPALAKSAREHARAIEDELLLREIRAQIEQGKKRRK